MEGVCLHKLGLFVTAVAGVQVQPCVTWPVPRLSAKLSLTPVQDPQSPQVTNHMFRHVRKGQEK